MYIFYYYLKNLYLICKYTIIKFESYNNNVSGTRLVFSYLLIFYKIIMSDRLETKNY